LASEPSDRAVATIIAEAELRLATMQAERARLETTPDSTESELRALESAIAEITALIAHIKRQEKL
jgi:septal ring factor EnvC (AmiA/AmiB activator)